MVGHLEVLMLAFMRAVAMLQSVILHYRLAPCAKASYLQFEIAYRHRCSILNLIGM
jgi:hypothetical protein